MSSEPVRERIRRGIDAPAEYLLRAAFAVRRPSRSVPRLALAREARALVVAPHPDDEAAGCAGALLAHRAAGHETRVVVVTDGRRSGALGLSSEAMARRRREEAEAAAVSFGASLRWIGLPEGTWEDSALLAVLEQELTTFRPTVVYAPSRVDFHPEHLRVANVLGRALASPRLPPGLPLEAVRIYQVQVPLSDPLVNRFLDVTEWTSDIQAILGGYVTQWGSLERTLRIRRYAAARHGVRGLVEEFWEVPPQRYAEVHAGHPFGDAGFRGLRRHPLTDALAYLKPAGARRHFLATSSP